MKFFLQIYLIIINFNLHDTTLFLNGLIYVKHYITEIEKTYAYKIVKFKLKD